jgi:helicase
MLRRLRQNASSQCRPSGRDGYLVRSEGLAEQVDAWLESRPVAEKGVLFPEWVMGSSGKSRADELLGSLGLPVSGGPLRHQTDCRKAAYVAMLNAIVLDERSRGIAVADVQTRWALSAIESAEESWRDTTLWLLGGHLAVCDIRAFYHHLREVCAAQPEQVRAAKRALTRMRRLTFELMERLRYCSPLGSFLVDLRRSARSEATTVGVGTIRALEEGGVRSVRDLACLDEAALVRLGVQKRFARQVVAYCRKRKL